jgi:NAD(P)-dependent dehydrogenase (short-subunit alcohol dehydrogenase family)
MGLVDRFRLDGKVCIVTGASSGLGVAFARGLADAGGSVVITGRRGDRLEAVRASLCDGGARALAVTADVTAIEDCERVVSATLDEFGSVDVLVNNAGVAGAAPATREEPDHFRAMIEVNLLGTYWMTQAAGRAMRSGSSIVNVSSVLALTTAGLPQAAYSASKAGILGLTMDLASQWTGRKGIRVNAVAPAFFPSEMLDLYDPSYMEETVDRRVLLGRIGDPEECAAAVLFLASDASSYITGIVLPVDGGMRIT